MNPLWAASSWSNVDQWGEKMACWLCDSENWKLYKTDESSYAMGSPSVEMFVKAYNVYCENFENSSKLSVVASNSNGYGVQAGETMTDSGNSTSAGTVLKKSPYFFGGFKWWLASPGRNGSDRCISVVLDCLNSYSKSTDSLGVCPIVPLDM